MKKKAAFLLLASTILPLTMTSCFFWNKPQKNRSGILLRSINLANNIDKLPKSKEAMLKSNKNVRRNKDVTARPEEVAKYPALNSYYESLWNYIDGTIEDVKERKNRAVSIIDEFDKWIAAPEGDFKLSYDLSSDTTTISYGYIDVEGFQYLTARSTYDEQNRMMISFYLGYYSLVNNQIVLRDGLSVSYVENLCWDVSRNEGAILPTGENYYHQYLIHADLTKDNREVTQLYRLVGIDAFESNITSTVQTSGNKTTTISDMYGNNIYDTTGYNLAMGTRSHLDIALYQLSGYSRIELDDSIEHHPKYTMTTSSGVYEGDVPYTINGNRVMVNGIASGISSEPCLSVSFSDGNLSQEEMKQGLTDVLNAMGLAYLDEDAIDEAIASIYSAKDVVSSRSALNKTDMTYCSVIEYEMIWDLFNRNNPSDIDLQDYLDAEKYAAKEQIEETTPYEESAISSQGRYSLDEENNKLVVDSFTIIAEAEKLEQNADYTAYVAIKNVDGMIEIGRSQPVNSGEGESFTINIDAIDFDLDDLPLSMNNYSVITYLVDSDGNRVSGFNQLTTGNSNIVIHETIYDYGEDYGREDIQYKIVEGFRTVSSEDGSSLSHYIESVRV